MRGFQAFRYAENFNSRFRDIKIEPFLVNGIHY